MADTEKKVIIEVGTGQSAQTLGQLREAVIDAQKSLLMLGAEVKNGTKSEEEYQQALVQAKVAQEQYNKEMRVQVKENQAVKGSYNDLVNQLSRLKEQWKNAAPGTEKYRQLTAEVNAVKKQLESQDHEIGNWQRNVGNYANSLAGIFRGVGGGIGAAAQGIVGLNTKMTALSANPAMAVLSVLAVVLQKISEAFSSSEAAANKLAIGFAPLKAGGQALTRVFQSVANALGSAAEWMTKMADKLGWLSDEQKKNLELTKSEIALREEQRRVTVENARLEMEIAEARAKAQDKANYSASERVKLLAEVRQKEEQILKNQLRIAEEEFRIAKEKATLTENDAAANDELADKEANLYRIREQHATGMRRINREYTQALKDQGVELEKIEKTLGDIFKLTYKADEFPGVEQINRFVDNLINRKDEMTALMEQMNAEELAAISAEIDAETAAWLDSLNIRTERTKMSNEDIINSSLAVATAIADIGDMIADAYADEIKAKVESGEISEAEGERQFENVKAIQYATTWINTLAGMTAALSSPVMNALGPAGWIASAAQAATILASGIAQTVKIKNTQLGGSANTSGSTRTNTEAPIYSRAIPQTRIVTSAEDEERLNSQFGSIKAYIVSSEAEGQLLADQQRREESTF